MVAARSTEIGVKIALGARPGQILTQVAGKALRPLAIAIVGGTGMALLVAPAFRYVLFDVAPADLLTFACVCALLVAVAAMAAVIPGRAQPRSIPLRLCEASSAAAARSRPRRDPDTAGLINYAAP